MVCEECIISTEEDKIMNKWHFMENKTWYRPCVAA